MREESSERRKQRNRGRGRQTEKIKVRGDALHVQMGSLSVLGIYK